MTLEKILKLNPWLENPLYESSNYNLKKRAIFTKVCEAIDSKFIVSLSGLRRTGKTTLLKQLLEHYLRTNKRLFYYQFDEDDTDLDSVLKYFFDGRMGGKIHGDVEAYIFLDELQYVDGWQEKLKFYYDINRNLQFVVTGSASLYLNKDTKESLAGRILDFKIEPLSFDEYLYLKYDYAFDSDCDLSLGVEYFISQIVVRSEKVSYYRSEIWRFLIHGEFPELLSGYDYSMIRKYLLESIIQKIFRKDIRVFEVGKLDELETLFRVLSQNIGQFVSHSALSSDIALSRPTLKNYMEVLEDAFLVKFIKNDLKSLRSQEKAYDKVYASSVNLILAMLGVRNLEEALYLDLKGHVIENYVFNQIEKIYKNVDLIKYSHKEKREVDFVLQTGMIKLPVEVKIRAKLRRTDFNNIFRYMEENSLEYGAIFYSGEYGEEIRNGKKVFMLNWI